MAGDDRGRSPGHIPETMPFIDSIDPGPRRRVTLVVGLLVVALVCVAALAWQAHRANRSHRVATERALQETVEFAAWSYASGARRNLMLLLFDLGFDRIESVAAGDGTAGVRELLADPELPFSEEYLYGFHRDLRSGETAFEGDVPAAARRFVADSLERADYDLRWHQGASLVDGSSFLAWRFAPKTGEPEVAYGFGVSRVAVEWILEGVFDQLEVLPPGFSGNRPNSELFQMVVTTPEGSVFYRGEGTGPDRVEAMRAADTLGSVVGGLEVELAALPAVLGSLPGTPAPGPGWPLYAGLVALVAGLTLAAGVLMRREHQLARAHTDFVSSVTHALRTPLAQIRLYGETLALGRERGPEERERALRVILREADRLDRMVDDVLAFVRSGGGGQRPERRRTDLRALAEETVEEFRGLAEPRGTRLRVEGDGPAIAEVDPTAVRKAVANLIDNALKYGPADQTVTVRVNRWNGRVRIAVEDEGPGVPAESRDRVWRPFERLEIHHSTGGTGIGLAVVSRIAADHDGIAQVEDRPGGGARFLVTLPAAGDDVPAHPEERNGERTL